MVPGVMNQTPYWPQLPVVMPPAYQNQEAPLKDQASIKNFLIQLGERFSDDHQQSTITNTTTSFQYPVDVSFTQDQIYASSMSINNINDTCFQLSNTHYNVSEAGPNMIQGTENFPVELSELFYSNQQQLDGFESFYGMDMVNGSTGTSSAESSSWGDMSSLVYPQMVSDYEACQQRMLQVASFEKSKYFGQQ